MSERNRDALIGLCAILAVISLIVLLGLFGEIDTTRTWRLSLLVPDTAGITDSSRVSLDGVPIGSIEAVALDPDGTWPVRITARIDEGIVIPAGVTPLTTASLLTGAANLSLESPTPRTGEILPVDGTAELTGEIHSSTVRDLTAAIDERVGPTLVAIKNLGKAWSPVGTGLSELLGPPVPGEAATLPGVVQRADTVLAAAASWLEDPELRAEAGEVLHMALAAVDRAVTAIESFDTLVSNLDSHSTTVADEVAGAGRALSDALHQASTIMTTLREGEGTAGQLLTNADLYNNLDETAKQLGRLSESMKLMVEQIREEGVGPLLAP
jgi:ABC-type transporter Mla subunit MlaD